MVRESPLSRIPWLKRFCPSFFPAVKVRRVLACGTIVYDLRSILESEPVKRHIAFVKKEYERQQKLAKAERRKEARKRVALRLGGTI